MRTQQLDFPLLPLRDVVVYPHMVLPLFVGREKSIKALQSAMDGGKEILLVAQKIASEDEPRPGELYEVGTVASILQLLKLPDGTVKVLIEGGQRAQVSSGSAEQHSQMGGNQLWREQWHVMGRLDDGRGFRLGDGGLLTDEWEHLDGEAQPLQLLGRKYIE